MKNLYFLIVLTLCACKTNTYDTFTRENTPSSNITGEVVYDFDNDFNLHKLIVYNDSIWIKVFNADPLSKNLVQFCNLKDTSQNKGYLTYGKASLEIISAVPSLNDNFLVINDMNQGNKTLIFNMDSVFKDHYIPKIINTATLATNFFVLKNEDILFDNRFFLSISV